MFAGRFKFYLPESIVVVTRIAPGWEEFDQRQNYRIVRIPLSYRGPKGFEWLGPVWSFVRAGLPLAHREKVQVVQCARPLPEGVAALILAKLLFKRLVVNFHGEDISVLQNYRVERSILRRLISSADLNLANSNFTSSLIRKLGGPGATIKIIYPGFDRRPFERVDLGRVLELRKEIAGSPVVLTVGRLQRRKGQDNVIRALPSVAVRFPDVKYVIVGSSHGGTEGMGERLKALAAEVGVENRVLLIGEVGEDDLALYLSACDLFVMPNREDAAGDVEGFGIVFLEAGFLGKPVVGGRFGGTADAVLDGETGLLVDGRSVEEISEALIRLLSDRELSCRMGTRGRQFALEMTNAKMFETYRSLMIGKGL